ncbi:unnamed protein product [Blepharisma stoltei]|uniref:Uncharacterized protein n=1 Tax=Blepharisma stoltei TaxID=1481888 RepID=A0AAU9JTZ1_9CILI|nr:unnamed protein product [Blepharisma stoltei]
MEKSYQIQENDENLNPFGEQDPNLSPISRMLKKNSNDPLFEFRGLQVSTPKKDMFGPPPLCTPSFGHLRNHNF